MRCRRSFRGEDWNAEFAEGSGGWGELEPQMDAGGRRWEGGSLGGGEIDLCIQAALEELEQVGRRDVCYPPVLTYDRDGIDMALEEKQEILARSPTEGHLCFFDDEMMELTFNPHEVACLLPAVGYGIWRQLNNGSDRLFFENNNPLRHLGHLTAYLDKHPETLAPYPDVRMVFEKVFLLLLTRELQRLRMPYDFEQKFAITCCLLGHMGRMMDVHEELEAILSRDGRVFAELFMNVLAQPRTMIRELWPTDLQWGKMPLYRLIVVASDCVIPIGWKQENLEVVGEYLGQFVTIDVQRENLVGFLALLGTGSGSWDRYWD